MRYSESEATVLVGTLKPGLTVKIKIIELSNDNLVELNTDACIESEHLPGVYLWSTTNINDNSLIGYSNLLYEMTSIEDNKKFYGKFIFGGYPDKSVDVDLTSVEEQNNEIIEKVDIINARI